MSFLTDPRLQADQRITVCVLIGETADSVPNASFFSHDKRDIRASHDGRTASKGNTSYEARRIRYRNHLHNHGEFVQANSIFCLRGCEMGENTDLEKIPPEIDNRM